MMLESAELITDYLNRYRRFEKYLASRPWSFITAASFGFQPMSVELGLQTCSSTLH
jgi:hypothetical protein